MIALPELQQQIDQIRRDLEQQLPELFEHDALEAFALPNCLSKWGRSIQHRAVKPDA